MKRDVYLELRSELVELGFFRPNPLIGVTALIVETLLFVTLCYTLTQVEQFSLEFWAIQVVLGVSMFRFFALLHECGHRAMFSSRGLNTIWGVYASLFCFVPYVPWRNLHLLHHKWVGVIDKDPTQVGLLKLKNSSKLKLNLFRVVWKLCIPIPSIQLIFSVFWLYPFKLFMQKEYSKAWGSFASVFACLVPHTAALAVFGLDNYVIYVLPMLFMFFLWFEIINFTHHSELFPYTSETHPDPIPLHEQDAVSRTSAFSRIISTIFAYNFNFHTEHHYFPTIPWHHLPKVYDMLKKLPANPNYNDVSFLGLSIHLRSKNPLDVYVKSLP